MMTVLLLLCVALCWADVEAVAMPTQFVTCKTTASDDMFVIELKPEWAPRGVERFLALVKDKFFDHSPLFRVVKGFLVQFGVAAQPAMTKKWQALGPIPDDPLSGAPPPPFKRGYLSFAGSGPNSRTTELFIAYKDSTHLGNSPWETPIGIVKYGMETVDKFYAGYGDVAPFGNGPQQGELYARGNEYVASQFPSLDKIESCSIMRILGHDDEHEGTDAADDDDSEDAKQQQKQQQQQQQQVDASSSSTTYAIAFLLLLAIAGAAWRLQMSASKGDRKFTD